MPWGPSGEAPTYEYCNCCGVEFGYGDGNSAAINAHIERWKRGGVPVAGMTYEDYLAKKEQDEEDNGTNT